MKASISEAQSSVEDWGRIYDYKGLEELHKQNFRIFIYRKCKILVFFSFLLYMAQPQG